MQALPNPLRGALLSLAAFAAYAGSDVSIKALGLSLHALQVMFVAALCTLPWIVAQILVTDRRASLRPVLPGWTVLRLALTIVNSALVTYVFTQLPLAQAYAVFFTMPLMITVLAWPMLGEPIDPWRGAIVLVGFCGVLIALRPGEVTFEAAHLAAFLGATLGAVNSLILRKIGHRERAGVILLYPVLGQVVAGAMALPYVWRPMALQDWAIAAQMGLLGTVGGLCIIAAYRLAPAIVVAPMQYSQIIWAGILGYLIFGERLEPMTALGIGVIIAAGLALLVLANRSAVAKTGLALSIIRRDGDADTP